MRGREWMRDIYKCIERFFLQATNAWALLSNISYSASLLVAGIISLKAWDIKF